jgi:hypothetical protein
MSASTRTVQQTLGTTRQIGAALVAVALAIVLAAVLAFSQIAAPQTKTAPAAGTAPVFVDHGSRDEIRYPGSVIGVDRGYRDNGAKGNADKGRLNFGSSGPGPQAR